MKELKQLVEISIHAPLRGRPADVVKAAREAQFQSTPPCGGDMTGYHYYTNPHISIHAPLRGRRGLYM